MTTSFSLNPSISGEGDVFSPHITSPKGGEVFNLGKVQIDWDINDPPTDDEYGITTVISYELEYTEKYNGNDTV